MYWLYINWIILTEWNMKKNEPDRSIRFDSNKFWVNKNKSDLIYSSFFIYIDFHFVDSRLVDFFIEKFHFFFVQK